MDQLKTDVEHLRLLSIFHYVVGAITGLFSLLPITHVAIGVAMVTGRFERSEEPPPAMFGWFFIGMGLVFIVCGLALATCLVLAGRFLSRREHYLFCFVMAALACIFFPFGTVLGVFTIIVLSRPTVKELFTSSRSAAGLSG